MNHTALVTGASAGLGAEFSRQLASQGYNVVLVARTADRLQKLAADLRQRYEVRAEVIAADLSTDDGVGAVTERLTDPAHPVHVLVNNAGHGLAAPFVESDLEDERTLLRLHVQTTMELTHAAARVMTARRGGRIINVSSVAGYTPTGTYSAAKAWVINFSKALHQQLKPSGVYLTVVCPGLVRTEFHERSGIRIAGAKNWMWLSAEDVVRQALTANAQGAAQSVPSTQYRALTASLKFIPDRVVHWAADRRLGVPGQEDDAGTGTPAGTDSAPEAGSTDETPSGAENTQRSTDDDGSIADADQHDTAEITRETTGSKSSRTR
ncbi:SDR family NAD(P)-dependent oxidoreductase [Nesterenkonia alba]|uniref:SDR family NAD(P)-dependent oxidoreductase n=1 Tax=Nesterenkonia alba TaxID=515814 RepID=UPI0003B33279